VAVPGEQPAAPPAHGAAPTLPPIGVAGPEQESPHPAKCAAAENPFALRSVSKSNWLGCYSFYLLD